MEIEIKKQIGIAIKESGAIKRWRASPGDLTLACQAAFHYAAKDGKTKVVVPGNSYGSKVYHIANESDDLKKFTVMATSAVVAVVDAGGAVYQAVAS